MEGGLCGCCWLANWGIVWITKSFIVCNITLWNDVKRWLIIFIIVLLFNCSCSVASFLKDASISSLNVLLVFLHLYKVIMRKEWYNGRMVVSDKDGSWGCIRVRDIVFRWFFSCYRWWGKSLRFLYHRKLESDVYPYFWMGYGIEWWKVYILFGE